MHCFSEIHFVKTVHSTTINYMGISHIFLGYRFIHITLLFSGVPCGVCFHVHEEVHFGYQIDHFLIPSI